MSLNNITDWLNSFATQYGYIGIFIISLIGSTSIFFPIPSSVVIFTLAGQNLFDPFWIAVAAGLGAAVGEFSGYLIGFGGRKLIGERYKKKMDLLARLFKRYGSIVIFVFALTPLPDDLLFIPLGVMRYSLVRAFIPALIGKFASNLLIAYSGRFFITAIKDLFGAEGEGMSLLIGIVLAIVLMVIILIIMFKVNWEKTVEKFLQAKESEDLKKAKRKTAKNEPQENNRPRNNFLFF